MNDHTQTYRLGVLRGDGIGPEIVDPTLAILEAAAKKTDHIHLEWVHLPMGFDAIQKAGDPIPQETLKQLETCHGWITGPQDNASYPDEFKQALNPSGRLRAHFDLYANIRPAKNLPSVPSLVRNTDLVIVRENTEGFYPDRNMHEGVGEFMPTPDIALSTGVFTRSASERIAHIAFRLAQNRNRHVTIVHKANVIRLAHGLFLNACKDVARSYPGIRVDDHHIDAMAAHLVRRPENFDIILATNMFGDILSDLTAELVGSLGLGGSLNAGDRHAMAQAVHGAAPDIAGKGIANPIGLLHSAVMLLDWLAKKHNDPHLSTCTRTLEEAIENTLTSGPLTPDLGGNANTQKLTQSILNHLNSVTRPD